MPREIKGVLILHITKRSTILLYMNLISIVCVRFKQHFKPLEIISKIFIPTKETPIVFFDNIIMI